MFAGARIRFVWPVSAALALGLAACDLSRNKPETMTATRVGATPDGGVTDIQPVSKGEAASGERSIRLYGPGVSPQRQTRI